MRGVEKEKVKDGAGFSLSGQKGVREKWKMCCRGLLLSPFFRSVHTREGLLVKCGTALLHETAWLSNPYPHFFPFSICMRKRTKKNREETKRTSLLSSSSPHNQYFQQSGDKNTSIHRNLTGRQSNNGYKDTLPRKTRASSSTCQVNLPFRQQYHRCDPLPKNSDHKDPSGHLKNHAIPMAFQFRSPQIRIPRINTISIIDTRKPSTLRTSYFPALPCHPPNPRPPKPSTQQHRRPPLQSSRHQSNRRRHPTPTKEPHPAQHRPKSPDAHRLHLHRLQPPVPQDNVQTRLPTRGGYHAMRSLQEPPFDC